MVNKALSKLLAVKVVSNINFSKSEAKVIYYKKFFLSYLVVFVGYLCMYLIRKNYNISQNHLIETYGLTKTVLGQIAFTFSITYGLGKFLLGYYADGKNTKSIVAFLLILAAFANIAFGLSLGSSGVSVILMMIFMGFNGFFQSAGGPASVATITKWTARKNRGTFFGLWNISHNLGGALAATVALFGADIFFGGSPVGMFIFPALIAIVFGIAGLFIGNDSPQAYGLGASEEIFNEVVNKDDKTTEEQKLNKWQIFTKYILNNPYIWAICVGNIFVYIIRIGIDQWSVVYGRQVLGFTKEQAVTGFTMFELGAIFSLIFGWFSDVLKGRRALVSIIALSGVLVLLPIYQYADNIITYKLSLFGLGFLIFGPQLLLGVSLVGFVPKKAVSTADGLKGMFAYLLGDSFAKIGLAMMADGKIVLGLTGWVGTFSAIYTSVFIAMIILIFVVIGEERKLRAR
jgi:OPA family hexose phosphate transport protein UhpT-like MFS transporter